jgi:hypothetical protein
VVINPWALILALTNVENGKETKALCEDYAKETPAKHLIRLFPPSTILILDYLLHLKAKEFLDSNQMVVPISTDITDFSVNIFGSFFKDTNNRSL